MKKGIAIVAALGLVAGATAYFMLKRIKEELEVGLNMNPEDFNTPDGCECGCECGSECTCNHECNCTEESPAPEEANS